MDTTIQNLVNQLHIDDDDISGAALAKLIEIGHPAVPALQAAFATPEPIVRALVLEGLAMIADTDCADLFHQALEDDDDRVRAWAANGLARINDPEAIPALIRTIHDYPDELHAQYTLSAYTLIGKGPVVLPEIVPLLSDPNPYTREQAFLVITGIVTRMPEYEYSWDSLSSQLGSYDPNASAEARDRAARKWAIWAERYKE